MRESIATDLPLVEPTSVNAVSPDLDLASPILKWAGGKASIGRELAALFPRQFGSYFEPFLGGGAMFFRLAPTRGCVSDVNADLVAFYQAIARSPDRVHDELVEIFHYHRRDPRRAYGALRDGFNARLPEDSEVRRAAIFLYLNRVCFNGLFRVNQDGKFNVPLGDHDGCRGPHSIDQMTRASALLRRVEVRCCSYEVAVAPAVARDFVYFDPPYLTNEDVGFTSYTSDRFGLRDHEALVACACDLVSRGVYVAISNADTPVARRLYRRAKFMTRLLSAPRKIAARTASRGFASEILAIGGYR